MRARAPTEAANSVETLTLDGRCFRLEWRGQDDDLEVGHVGGVIGALIASEPPAAGQLLYAVEETGHVVGAGGVTTTGSDGAHVAVAVEPGWRRRGLGTAIARRVVEVARASGAQILTCRCPTGADDAVRTAALFGQECVSSVRVGFEQLLVLHLGPAGRRGAPPGGLEAH